MRARSSAICLSRTFNAASTFSLHTTIGVIRTWRLLKSKKPGAMTAPGLKMRQETTVYGIVDERKRTVTIALLSAPAAFRTVKRNGYSPAKPASCTRVRA
jgi:hypothetical protein